jgi:hypothetical protein
LISLFLSTEGNAALIQFFQNYGTVLLQRFGNCPTGITLETTPELTPIARLALSNSGLTSFRRRVKAKFIDGSAVAGNGGVLISTN